MSTTALIPYPVHYPSPALRYLCEAWWTCYSGSKHFWRQRSDCLIATGQALSVIPRRARELLDPQIRPAPGWKGHVPSWYDVPCGIGRVTLWLPIEQNLGQFRDFSLLALLPRDEVPDAPPFIHLGMQFLLEYRGQLHLD